jgi:cob(I)alamin adenosyltransferase
MRVYTRNGDDGTTTGYDGNEYKKDDQRIELIGVLDEFLARLDRAIVELDDQDKIDIIDSIQDTLWQTAGELSLGEPGQKADKTIQADDIDRLEDIVDEYNPEISHFIRYRTKPGTALNTCRVDCRRLERRLTPAMRNDDLRPVVYEYVNRLSDALYVLACSEERRLRAHKD